MHHANGLLLVHPLPAFIPDPPALKTGFSQKEDNGKLFDHVPTAADVRQGAVGDCYYLAAAMAILHRPAVHAIAAANGAPTNPAEISGAEFIESMMRDHGDKTVTVRFFEKDAAGVFQPDYVRVRKTFVHDKASSLFNKVVPPRAQKILWVKVLEKAWAAFTNGKVLGPNYFETIEAGTTPLHSPDGALAAFLATDTVVHGLRTQDPLKLPWGGINPSGLIGPASPGLQQRFTDIKNNIFGGNALLANQWESFLRAHAIDFYNKAEFRREDFEHIAAAHNMAPALKAHLDGYFDHESLLPGKRGTAIYTQQQQDAFTLISTALTQRKAVQLGSNPNVGIADRVGHSAGEPVTRGLVGNHAFSVVAVRTDAAAPHRKWVQIRNPWGTTGRTYTAHPTQANVLKAKEQSGGEMWIELADLTKRFMNINVGGVVRQI